MKTFIDHYLVLGLPSTHQSFQIPNTQITKAYRSKALELHPDKRLNDPKAVACFQSLQASYEILKNERTRKAFDCDLKIRLQQQQKRKRRERAAKERNDKDDERRRNWQTHVVKIVDDLKAKMGDMKEAKIKRMKIDRDVKMRMASFSGMIKGLMT